MTGKIISHYKILEKLGEGGMGVVYKAQDTKLDRFVALKFLPPQMGGDDEEKQRFIQEAKAASALDHNNICVIHEIGETDSADSEGQLFIAMAYYEGQTLDAVLGPTASRAPLSLEDALDYASQISEGLSKAHEKEIVHRDLKPANVMITNDGVVKILDFGLAKLGGHSKLTKAGTTLGTTGYMSPEQARGEDVDRRTDIFSLGVLLYAMLTGRHPFQGDYEQAVIYSIINEEPEPVTGLRSGIPMELEGMVNKCLRKEASARYQHVEDLLVDLKVVQDAEKSSVSKTQLTAVGARRTVPAPKRRILIGGIAALMFLAVVGYFFFAKEPQITERVPIAVVDFVNQTNEPELNGLSGLLITALEQSRRLAVMSRARMFDELKKMGKPDVTFVDEATGREIAKRTEVRALAVATIRKLGQLYTIDFKVMAPVSGDYLFTAREEGEGQESILGMIDQLSEKTRIDLREQPQTIQLRSRSVADVTTTNLQAYQHYFLGEQLTSQNKSTQAVEEYRKAIALDSTFALAYYRLAYALNWDFAEELAKVPLRKAFELIDRIPEKERYLLRALKARTEKGYAAGIPVAKEMEAVYPDDKEMLYFIGDWAFHARQYQTAEEYLNRVLALDPTHELALTHLCYTYRGTKQYDKFKSAVDRLAAVHESVALQELGFYHRSLGEYQLAIENFEKAYKRDSTRTNSLNTIAISYMRAHQYDKALEYAQKYLSVNPVPVAYFRISNAYRLMGDLTQAEEILQLGLQSFPNSSLLLGLVGTISAYSGNYEKAKTQFEEMLASHYPVGVRRSGFSQLAYLYAYLGQYSKSSEMYDERISFHRSDLDTNSVAEHTARKAYWLYLGYRDKNQVYSELEKLSQFQNVTNESYYYNLARLYNLIGDFQKANIAAKQVSDTTRQLQIESAAWMAKKEWDKAIGVNNTIIEEWRPEAQTIYGYYSAVCYFEKGELDQAIKEVKKAASSYGWDHAYVYPHSFYLLGKIYEKKSDTQQAVENTEKFLDLWKDADPDLPDLIDAKARLARLKESTQK